MPKAVRNPLAFIAERWTPRPETVRRAALAALVMSVVIVVTGGAVRLTGSGLGCDTWPKCSDDSLVATSEMGVHGLIEFANRMMAYVVSAAVGWVIVASRAAKPHRRGLTRLGWAQFWVVMSNGVIGGITVLTELNPYIVAAHFLAATALITAATVTWQRAREGDAEPRPLVGVPVRRAVWGLTALVGALLVAGTAVTGSGKHAGDNSDIERMPFDWEWVTRVHSGLAWAVVLGTVALWIVLRLVDAPQVVRDRARDLFVVLMAQGVIGYTQYALDEPEVLVGIHLLGSSLVWIATLRFLLATRERGQVPAAASGDDREDAAPLATATTV
ncbi:COX15/CtaA family protein [Streptomyces litchfieldiae]|uniref:COX15/CtaA family protein n=1 Tax=Streptomyces litchfieldiae TaxID=3075543 RepID=A0ABU2MV80_9ACTN|nr:COX15/CtaA family protein [Streptomyces sp. DSM 44938]MDT0344753.1 COX15/CtaA family protein [Streptomyces sp. DSM 44938]